MEDSSDSDSESDNSVKHEIHKSKNREKTVRKKRAADKEFMVKKPHIYPKPSDWI